MAKRQRNHVLERQWRERVSAWAKSGLTIRDFCLRHGVTESSFHFWKRELQTRDEVSAVSPSLKPTFVPVTVIPATTTPVEVRCPSGHVVILSSCDSLSNLFAALASPVSEGRPC